MLRLQTALGNSTTARQIIEMGAAGGIGYWQGGTPGAVTGALAAAAVRRGGMKINEGLSRKVGELLASADPAALQQIAKMAVKSPAVLKLIDSISDQVGKVAGLSPSAPLEITVRPRGVPVNLPAAADQEQQ